MYCTQEQVEGCLQRPLTTYEALNIKLYIESAQDYIDSLTGRSWSEGASSKLYNGDGSNTLFIDAVKDITAIERLDLEGNVIETLDTNTYTLYPLNNDVKTYIARRGYRFSCGLGNYRVVGTLNGTVPSGIAHATALLVADGLSNTNNIKSESIEGWSVTYADSEINDDVLKLLQPYIKVLL